MAEIKVLNANCDCATDGACDCDLSELHVACNRNAMFVSPTLPATGVEGTTYLIGNNTDGYTEYVWNGSAFVEMGTATGSFIRIMTVDELGVAKISNAAVLNAGASVGLDGNNRLRVPVANLSDYGVVKIGSQYPVRHAFPYHIGVGVAPSSGQLMINLAETQSDDSPGCLIYRKKTYEDGQQGYELTIQEASASQMGICKLLSSLSSYSDDELNAMRNTHAASVGLVLDGLESFCWDFFTDTRIKGYFDIWATGKDLAQQIWDDDAKREALFENVVDVVLGDANFKLQIDTVAKKWLTDKFTDAFVVGLFQNDILAKTKEISDAHWDDDLESTIQSTTEKEVEKQLPDAMAEFIANPDNVEIVAESVKEKVQESVSEDANTEALNYAKNVFNSSQEIEIGGVKTTFAAYFNAQIGNHVAAIKASLNASVAVALNRSYTTEELFVAQPQKTEYNVELKSVSGYDILVVDYLANGGEEASLCIDLNIARAVSPRPLCVAAGGVNGANIDTKYGSNDVTPCVKLDLTSNTLTWWYYGPYGSRSGIKRVCGLKGARLP